MENFPPTYIISGVNQNIKLFKNAFWLWGATEAQVTKLLAALTAAP